MFKNLNGGSKNAKAERRRREIVGRAADAFRKHGVRGAGMREIARAAGLTAGNLYYYFRSKQELVYFCQDRTLDALLEVARSAKNNYGSRRQLGALIEGHLRVLLDEQASGLMHLEFDDLPPTLHKKIVDKRDRYE